MFCPRCQKPMVSCIGADANGERFQCRFCANEWYAAVEHEAAKELLDGKVSGEETPSIDYAVAELEKLQADCIIWANRHRQVEREAAQASIPNTMHQNYGAQMALFKFADFISARIRAIKGES